MAAMTRDLLRDMYRRMVQIRGLELAAIDLFKRGQLKGAATTYTGMEASAVGVCMALRPDDLIVSNHRGHGHTIAKGAGVRRMMARAARQGDRLLRGRGGSMHIAAFETGSLGALPVVGAGIPIGGGCGARLQDARRGPGGRAIRGRRRHQHRQLPREPEHGIHLGPASGARGGEQPVTPFPPVSSEAARVATCPLRAAGYGIPGVRVDGFDVLAVHEAAIAAVARARAGEGPTLLVTESYRFDGHYAGEPEVYRDRSEVAAYREKDPIARFRRHLEGAGLFSPAELDAVDAEVSDQLEEALAFAKASPDPDPATALDYIYA